MDCQTHKVNYLQRQYRHLNIEQSQKSTVHYTECDTLDKKKIPIINVWTKYSFSHYEFKC